ncbi:hypothetical protein LCGC14_0403980 [marine sediment metagenome]|uniref:Uncharacterized protein n=1 Tax=marine sediment metagenome TaxID=412755 RepID=A0A0F9T1H6_9ZZZZ
MINREKLYDLIYNKADKLFKQYNPCEIGKNIFGEICCRNTLSTKLCCTGCEHLSKNGCTVRCVACKLCLCVGTGSIYLKLYKLRKVAYKYNLYRIRCSKKEIFGEENNHETI